LRKYVWVACDGAHLDCDNLINNKKSSLFAPFFAKSLHRELFLLFERLLLTSPITSYIWYLLNMLLYDGGSF